MKFTSLWSHYAHPHHLRGPMIEASLPDVFVGELCELRDSLLATEVSVRARVAGFSGDQTMLSILGPTAGLSRQMLVMPTGKSQCIEVSDAMLGAVLDANGDIVERISPERVSSKENRQIDVLPPGYLERASIDTVLPTGIRALDSLLTCGVGQRVGIFAPAGCGKTTLMNMLIEHADADVFVVGLIGERGREVAEFSEWLRNAQHKDRTVLVYSTSDAASVDRCNAAQIATTIAEHFRDKGKKVILLLDSLTRYARALRDLALAAGEMPARRGYPASVFDALPKLLERSGKTLHGSITAFYTVLLESEEEADPIGDEIRSILDGHIYLTQKLAGQGHFPAIDVLRSNSRLFAQITTPAHQALAVKVRTLLTKLEEMQLYVDLGEYRSGENADNDRAFSCKPALLGVLRQPVQEHSEFNHTLKALHAAVA